MSLENELKQINTNLEKIVSVLAGVAAPIESEVIQPAKLETAQSSFDATATTATTATKKEPVIVTTASLKADNAKKKNTDRAAVTARATELGIEWTTKTGTDALKKRIAKVEADANVVSHAGVPAPLAVAPEPVAPVGDSLDFGAAPEKDPTIGAEQTAEGIELAKRFLAKYTAAKDKATADTYFMKILANFRVNKISEIKAKDFDRYVAILAKNGITV